METAEVSWINKNGYWWVIKSCPFCGKKHEHSAPNITKGTNEFDLGSRLPHCDNSDLAMPQYRLLFNGVIK